MIVSRLTAAVVAALMLTCGFSPADGLKDLDVAGTKQLLESGVPEGLVILDLRTDEEFASGHLDGAVQMDFLADGFSEKLAALEKSTPYLIYCASGGRSGRTMAQMREAGFATVYHMKPGMRGWIGAGLDVVKSSAGEKTPLNVLVVLTDDQGWGDLSVNGNTNLETPNIDRLAAEGASFEHFYVCPVCSPTRAEFLTGRWHTRSGVYSTSAGGERMDLDEKTIGDTFKAAGYATGAFGKWHNGMQYPYHPNGRGFDEYYGFCSGHWGNYFSSMLERNGEIVTGEGFLVDDLTDKTLTFIENQVKNGKPFFAYVPYNTPHAPMQVPDKWWDKFRNKEIVKRHREPKKEDVDFTRAALAMCENIDWNVGRLTEKLDTLGIAENTVVMYFCDNGPNSFRWNGDMKGRKGATDEGGVRSPLIVRWPAGIKGGTRVTRIASVTDLLPTLADLAGVKTLPGRTLDGVSLKPLLTGEGTYAHDNRLIYSHWKKKVSVRSQDFRLGHKGGLFHIPSDPGQRKDVSAGHPKVKARLLEAAGKFRAEQLPGLFEDKRPFVIGHPGMKHTQIPARDGVAHGGIKRSNKYPNCSFFTNWTTKEDKIVWNAEVPESGDFEVTLYYTCPAADVGSVAELRFGDSVLSTKIAEAHDPPLKGAENDRVPRPESYVKDFKPLKIGTIRLEKGSGELTLQATEVPGGQVMDFRLLMLERK